MCGVAVSEDGRESSLKVPASAVSGRTSSRGEFGCDTAAFGVLLAASRVARGEEKVTRA